MGFNSGVILVVDWPDVEVSFEAAEGIFHLSDGVVDVPKLTFMRVFVICTDKIYAV